MKAPLCQIWIGTGMPEPYRGWCESMRTTAEALGMGYRLHGWQDVEARYAANPVMPILKQALQVLDTPTTYALISDWWRLRILADEGGWYADTDFEAHGLPDMPADAPDVSFFDEGSQENTALAAGMIYCKGERGRAAMRLMANEVERRLAEVLPADATDFAARYIRLVRNDTPGHKWSLVHVIGNAVINREILPKVRDAGYTVGAIPHAVASNRRYVLMYGGTSALWHMGAGSWVRRDAGYWPEMEAAAIEYDRRAAVMRLPLHLRPRGSVKLPDLCTARTRTAACEPDMQALSAVLSPPARVRRVVIFSNVLRGFPDFELQEGDWCIHINTARHLPDVLGTPGTKHALLFRYGTKREWYTPNDMTGLHHVGCVNEGSPVCSRPWYKQYVSDCPGKSPTTGYIATHIVRDLLPDVPLVLLGFDPACRHDTPQWHGHAWQYEAREYARQGIDLVKPQPVPRCKVLVGVCSCLKYADRRAACRATWMQHAVPGVEVRFFTGGAPSPAEPDVIPLKAGDDYDQLPEKVIAFMRESLRRYDFEWLFKCDDDTYCALDRLAALCASSTGADFIGDRPTSAGCVVGGAGYALRRKVVEAIVARSRSMPGTGLEDLVVTQAVTKLGVRTKASPLLRWDCAQVPTPSNNLVTAHLCYPPKMLTINHQST